MKITKNMRYVESDNAKELALYAENERDIYFNYAIPAIKNLHKKMKNFTYNPEKANILFFHVATEASKMYEKEFGIKFTVTERYTAGLKLLDGYMENIVKGDI